MEKKEPPPDPVVPAVQMEKCLTALIEACGMPLAEGVREYVTDYAIGPFEKNDAKWNKVTAAEVMRSAVFIGKIAGQCAAFQGSDAVTREQVVGAIRLVKPLCRAKVAVRSGGEVRNDLIWCPDFPDPLSK